MNKLSLTTLALTAALAAPAALAQITFYEHDGFRGRAFTTSAPLLNFRDQGFNDRASSVVVERGRWEVCQDNRFAGNCVVLRPGNYASLGDMGLNDQISSTRPANRRRPDVVEAPVPAPVAMYEYRRRPNERVFEAPITGVRAVVGEATERCWIDREQVSTRNEVNPGRAIVGAVLGGVIGHQVGGGSGRDLATAGGAVAGAVIGANTGRGNYSETRDVRRCENVPSTVPTYWDVSYRFRGIDHQMQTGSQPGRTVSVNGRGEPRQ